MLMLLLACRDSECIQNDRGVPSLSTNELDFGEVEPGVATTQVVTVTNVGTNLLPVGDIEIGAGTVDFTYTWDTAGVDCATEIPDTMWGEDTGRWFGPTDTSEPEEPAPTGFWLEPGCSLDLHVTYTATTPGEVQDALIVRRASGLDLDLTLPFAAAPFQKVVWLKGRTEGENETSGPELVGGVVDIDTFVNYPGDTNGFRVRMTDPEGGGFSYSWNTDLPDAVFDNPTGAETHLTFDPDLLCSADGAWGDASGYHVYALVIDADGNQFWAFVLVGVYPPTYISEPTCVPRTARGCGGEDAPECGETAAAALGLVFLRRRRRAGERRR